MTSDFDVIICGAGPAGCTAALALGSSGLKVALIDKRKFPSDKVCGDAIPGYVPKVLNTINPAYVRAFEDLPEVNKVSICRIIAPGNYVVDLNFPENGFVCKRLIFDSFLFDLVSKLKNITLFQSNPVEDVSVTTNNVVIITNNNIRLKANVIIGCDGANSIIRKKLAHDKADTDYCSVSVRAYFTKIKDTSPGTLEFHFLRNLLPGYFWIFPLPGNQFNVGLGMTSKMISQKKVDLRKELINIIKTTPEISYRFSEAEMTGEIKGHLLPLCSRKLFFSGNRYMLCGDAASLVNPATGAGIGQAMQSGRYAGWHTLRCFEKNDFSENFMKDYDKTIRDKICRPNRQYLMIRKFVFKYPAILNAIIGAGSASNLIKRTIIKNLK
jgi:geranylgeranyl reductase family protein